MAREGSLYSRARHWIGLLEGAPWAANYWLNSTLPRARRVSGRVSRTNCPALVREPSLWESATYCDSHWPQPQPGRPCVVDSIGIGNDWGFAEDANRRGCSVHGYDPTVRLRRKHER